MNILIKHNILNMMQTLSKQLIIVSFFILSIFTLQGCKEIYEPDLNHDKQYLVVEGMITNLEGPHEIKLSKTNVFGQGYEHIPVENASLKIADSENNVIMLEEVNPGSYYTPDSFSGKIDESYTLHITTESGETYKSKPQELMPPLEIDSFYGEPGFETFFYETHDENSIHAEEIEGVNLFIDVSFNDERTSKFRYKSVLMLQYKFIPANTEEEILYYCWEVKDITHTVDSDLIENLSQSESKRNRVGFLPNRKKDMKYIGFPVFKKDTTIQPSPDGEATDMVPITYLQPRIFSNSVYTLNDDAYSFYYERHRQTSNEGQLFDPIAPQIIGNIYSEDQQEEVVLGFFEASSVTRVKTYNIRSATIFDDLESFEMPDCSDCCMEELPLWWIQ